MVGGIFSLVPLSALGGAILVTCTTYRGDDIFIGHIDTQRRDFADLEHSDLRQPVLFLSQESRILRRMSYVHSVRMIW